MPAVAAPGDFVWRGRFENLIDGADGWAIPRVDVGAALDAATRVVVVDPLSFPWSEYGPRHECKPIVICVEDGDVADVVDSALGHGGLAGRLTPFDTVVQDREHLQAALSAPPPAGMSKEQFLMIADHVTTELEVVARTFGEAAPVVSVHGQASAPLRARLAGSMGVRTADEAVAGRAHAAVLLLVDDEPVSLARVREAVDAAARTLTPGGSLVVVGDVVTRPGGVARPRLSELFSAVDAATGGAVSVEEVRSIRWPGELLSRGVLLRYHALALSEDGGAL